MQLCNRKTKLCDVIFHDYSVIPLINRFGIVLGVGDCNIEEICVRHDIDVDFFLTILNTYINEDYFPEDILKSFKVSQIVDYLDKTDTYYKDIQIPNIERHFHSLIAKSEDSVGNLSLLQDFFGGVKSELICRIDSDCSRWFPYVKHIELNTDNGADDLSDAEFISCEKDSIIEDKLNDLCSFFIVHLRGTYNLNLCTAVISALSALEKDIHQNNRIRHRILRPMTLNLINRLTR